MANGFAHISVADWLGMLTFLGGMGTYALAKLHAMNKADAKSVISEEYSKLTVAINNLNTAVLKLNLQFDQIIGKQREQSKTIARQDGRLDEHEVRLAKLEEHNRKEE